MKYDIKHELEGRLRVHMRQPSMSMDQADMLKKYFERTEGIDRVKVYDKTCDAVINYSCKRADVFKALDVFSYEDEEAKVKETTDGSAEDAGTDDTATDDTATDNVTAAEKAKAGTKDSAKAKAKKEPETRSSREIGQRQPRQPGQKGRGMSGRRSSFMSTGRGRSMAGGMSTSMPAGVSRSMTGGISRSLGGGMSRSMGSGRGRSMGGGMGRSMTGGMGRSMATGMGKSMAGGMSLGKGLGMSMSAAGSMGGRALNSSFTQQLMMKVLGRGARRYFVPFPIRRVFITIRALRYLKEGIDCLRKGKIEVPVLDATAIGVSLLRGDFNTASSVMFLLSIGEMLENWTRKKSVDDLARSMSLNISNVWTKRDGKELLVPADEIHTGDPVIVRVGNVIPFDGSVIAGEAMVNQASLTGESLPVHKTLDGYVYAGTVLEEGELTIEVKNDGGASRYEKIVTMIEESEKLKSEVESKASHLADRLVPYTLVGTGLTWLLTRNSTKALSVLMVDYSCALKLAIPISVLSAIREANSHKITVKGGKYMEAVAEADTIVFDKTGTLTKATPTVVDVVSFCEESPDEMLRIAACLEEHFPHSMAKAVVQAASDKGLDHDEMHSKVEYIAAHGISTRINRKKAVIGSYHFVFEDEKCKVPPGMKEKFDNLPQEYSHLYLAIQKKLAAVILIEDPLREEAPEVIRQLRESGISKIVMMTGDSDRTAKAIAQKVGVDEYYSEVLPEDKSGFINKEKELGHKVIMIGDGVNDSPALSAADVGIAISDGAEIAREISDITISEDNLRQLVTLRKISTLLMKRIHRNYRAIVGVNSGLIAAGVSGTIQPTTSALLHNASTLGISMMSMRNLC